MKFNQDIRPGFDHGSFWMENIDTNITNYSELGWKVGSRGNNGEKSEQTIKNIR